MQLELPRDKSIAGLIRILKRERVTVTLVDKAGGSGAHNHTLNEPMEPTRKQKIVHGVQFNGGQPPLMFGQSSQWTYEQKGDKVLATKTSPLGTRRSTYELEVPDELREDAFVDGTDKRETELNEW